MKYLILSGKEYLELGAWVSLHSHFRSHVSPFHATRTTISAGDTILKNQRWNSGQTVLMLPALIILLSSERMPCTVILCWSQYSGGTSRLMYLLKLKVPSSLPNWSWNGQFLQVSGQFQLSHQPFQCQMREKQHSDCWIYFMGDGSALGDNA